MSPRLPPGTLRLIHRLALGSLLCASAACSFSADAPEAAPEWFAAPPAPSDDDFERTPTWDPSAPEHDIDRDELTNANDDDDGDGIPDAEEGADDADGDDAPNFLDLDSDGDGDADATDADFDNEGVPDDVEGWGDVDGDGFTDLQEDVCGTDPDDPQEPAMRSRRRSPRVRSPRSR